jgi:hypothetical protein
VGGLNQCGLDSLLVLAGVDPPRKLTPFWGEGCALDVRDESLPQNSVISLEALFWIHLL